MLRSWSPSWRLPPGRLRAVDCRLSTVDCGGAALALRLRVRLLFGLLVLAPLAALSLVGVWVARSEEARAAEEVRALLERKLEDLAVMLDGVAVDLQRELMTATERLPRDAEALRAL